MRAAVRELGNTGAAPDGDAAALQRELDATRAEDQATRAALAFRLGAAQRRAGDCAKALAAFSDVLAEVARGPRGAITRNPSYLWEPRAELAIGLCELETGHAVAALPHLRAASLTIRDVERPTSQAEHAEALFADGIAVWETGDRPRGKEMVLNAAADGSASLGRALEAWARAVGATLP